MNSHIQEKEQFKKLFQKERIDRFEDRFKILDVFLKSDTHLTSDELFEIFKKEGLGFSRDFVTETLELMRFYGFAQANRFQNGSPRYEPLILDRRHDHMVCAKCRKIIEFHSKALEDLQMEIAAAHGFHMLQHKMDIYGICSQCLKERSDLIPLARARAGETATIEKFLGGRRFEARMLSMGIRRGETVRIITNRGEGQLVAAVENRRFVIGSKMAFKILARPEAGPGKQRGSA